MEKEEIRDGRMKKGGFLSFLNERVQSHLTNSLENTLYESSCRPELAVKLNINSRTHYYLQVQEHNVEYLEKKIYGEPAFDTKEQMKKKKNDLKQ